MKLNGRLSGLEGGVVEVSQKLSKVERKQELERRDRLNSERELIGRVTSLEYKLRNKSDEIRTAMESHRIKEEGRRKLLEDQRRYQADRTTMRRKKRWSELDALLERRDRDRASSRTLRSSAASGAGIEDETLNNTHWSENTHTSQGSAILSRSLSFDERAANSVSRWLERRGRAPLLKTFKSR